MATVPGNPYSAFNFIVSLRGDQGGNAEGTVVGAFSEVSGLGSDDTFSGNRNGNVVNTRNKDDVTLKRGLVSTDLLDWASFVRDGSSDPRQISITLMDDARQPVATWKLRNAQPKKWTGPTLAADGGEGVAMEELTLVCGEITFED